MVSTRFFSFLRVSITLHFPQPSNSSHAELVRRPRIWCFTAPLTPVFYFLLDFQQPQILLLKEGTEDSQGKPQLISNINACQTVAEAVRTTLGPRGMDKLIVDRNGRTTISNDGATIMKLLEIVHPAAKTLVDIAKSQDAEVRSYPAFITSSQ